MLDVRDLESSEADSSPEASPSDALAGRRLRILYVINSLEGGGAAFPVPTIVQSLERHGALVRVCALTPRDLRALPAFEKAGVPVVVRNGSHRDHPRALGWLRRQVADFAPDLIWTSLTRATLLGQVIGQLCHVPVASWQHAAYLKRANAVLLRLRSSQSQLWIADSKAVAELTHSRLRIPQERIVTWPIFRADPTAPKRAAWSRGQTLRLCSLGRLHRVKGYDVLLDALKILEQEGFEAPVPWRIAVAGAGRQLDELRSRAAAESIEQLRFVGFEDDTPTFLADHHAYLQTSRSEGFCVAAHEAMQAGLPVLASAVGELANSIEPGVTGWLVPPGDPKQLARALAKLLQDPSRLADMGDQARLKVLTSFGPDAFDAVAQSILERLGEIVLAN